MVARGLTSSPVLWSVLLANEVSGRSQPRPGERPSWCSASHAGPCALSPVTPQRGRLLSSYSESLETADLSFFLSFYRSGEGSLAGWLVASLTLETRQAGHLVQLEALYFAHELV